MVDAIKTQTIAPDGPIQEPFPKIQGPVQIQTTAPEGPIQSPFDTSLVTGADGGIAVPAGGDIWHRGCRGGDQHQSASTAVTGSCLLVDLEVGELRFACVVHVPVLRVHPRTVASFNKCVIRTRSLTLRFRFRICHLSLPD